MRHWLRQKQEHEAPQSAIYKLEETLPARKADVIILFQVRRPEGQENQEWEFYSKFQGLRT